jgi:Txe/YoeB family toxin of Txe-Axe toxin-antitoxin module
MSSKRHSLFEISSLIRALSRLAPDANLRVNQVVRSIGQVDEWRVADEHTEHVDTNASLRWSRRIVIDSRGMMSVC